MLLRSIQGLPDAINQFRDIFIGLSNNRMPLVSFLASKIDATHLLLKVVNFDSQQVGNKRNFIGLL